LNDQELWASHENIPPPIDPKQLKPARQAQVHSDFLDWAADVPDPFQASRAYVATPRARPGAGSQPASADMDWEAGPSPHVTAAPPAPPPMPAPRRPGVDAATGGAWDDVAPVAPAFPAAAGNIPEPSAAVATAPIPMFTADVVPARAAAATTPPSFADGGRPPDAFVRELAKAAGLPESALAQKDPVELARQVGEVLRLVAENLAQLLDARRESKRLARSASHTTVEAVDNNPLKFSPSPADALRIMFGPATPSYLNAQQAIGQGFGQVKAHQIKTYSAMQHAVNALLADLDPHAIEQRTEEGRGMAGLLASRKAKLWDAYTAQWDSKIGRDGGGPIAAFMLHFAGFYDRDGG
jgi:type VI secretion system protein ImpI